MERHALAGALGQVRRAPAGLVADEFEHGLHALRVERRPHAFRRRVEQVEPELERVLAGFGREFIDERLDDERDRVAGRSAERSRRDAEGHLRRLEREVRHERLRELVRGHLRARGEARAFAERDEVVAPGHEVSGAVETALQIVVAAGAEVVETRVVLARPHQLDRNSRLPRDQRCLEHVVPVQAPAEASSHPGQVDRDPVLWDAERLGQVAARELRSLDRRPHFEPAIVEVRRRVLRFERRVGEEGVPVGRLDRLRRGGQGPGRVAVVPEILFRRLLRQLLGLPVEGLGALGRGRALFPGDIELAPRLVDQPPGVADDGDAVGRRDLEHRGRGRGASGLGGRVDHEGVGHAGRGLDRVEIGGLHLAAVDPALLEHGVLHAGHRDVDAEKRFAGDDLRVVDPADLLADDLEVRGVLERDGPGIGRFDVRRGGRQLAVGQRLLLEVDDAGLGRALLRIGLPLPGSGRDEHGAGGGAHAAHRLVVHGRRHAAAGHLAAVLRRIEVRLLDADLAPRDVELLGDEHRQHRLDALADLGVLGHDRRDAVRGQPDEGVERRLGAGIGGDRSRAARAVQREAGADQHAAAGQGGDVKEAAPGEGAGLVHRLARGVVGRVVGCAVDRVVCGVVHCPVHDVHASLPPPPVAVSWLVGGACAISAARWIAARMRV